MGKARDGRNEALEEIEGKLVGFQEGKRMGFEEVEINSRQEN